MNQLRYSIFSGNPVRLEGSGDSLSSDKRITEAVIDGFFRPI